MATAAELQEIANLIAQGDPRAVGEAALRYGATSSQVSALGKEAGFDLDADQIQANMESLGLGRLPDFIDQTSSGGSTGDLLGTASNVYGAANNLGNAAAVQAAGGVGEIGLTALVPGIGLFANLVDLMGIFDGGGLGDPTDWEDLTPEQQANIVASNYRRQIAEGGSDIGGETTEGAAGFDPALEEEVYNFLVDRGQKELGKGLFTNPLLSNSLTQSDIPEGYVRDEQGFLRDVATGQYWILDPDGEPFMTTPPLLPVPMPDISDAGGGGGGSEGGGSEGGGSEGGGSEGGGFDILNPSTDVTGNEGDFYDAEHPWEYDAETRTVTNVITGETAVLDEESGALLEDGGRYSAGDGGVIDDQGNKVADIQEKDGINVLVGIGGGDDSEDPNAPVMGPQQTVTPSPAPNVDPVIPDEGSGVGTTGGGGGGGNGNGNGDGTTDTPTDTPVDDPTDTTDERTDDDPGEDPGGGTGGGTGGGDGDGDGPGIGTGLLLAIASQAPITEQMFSRELIEPQEFNLEDINLGLFNRIMRT